MENLYRKAIFSICLFFFTLSSVGTLQGQIVPNWTLQAENDGVRLYSATVSCSNKNMLVFKIENTNAAVKHVNYNVIIQSAGRNMPVLPQSVELAASETKVGDCDSNKELIADLKGVDNYQLKVMMVIN